MYGLRQKLTTWYRPPAEGEAHCLLRMLVSTIVRDYEHLHHGGARTGQSGGCGGAMYNAGGSDGSKLSGPDRLRSRWLSRAEEDTEITLRTQLAKPVGHTFGGGASIL